MRVGLRIYRGEDNYPWNFTVTLSMFLLPFNFSNVCLLSRMCCCTVYLTIIIVTSASNICVLSKGHRSVVTTSLWEKKNTSYKYEFQQEVCLALNAIPSTVHKRRNDFLTMWHYRDSVMMQISISEHYAKERFWREYEY